MRSGVQLLFQGDNLTILTILTLVDRKKKKQRIEENVSRLIILNVSHVGYVWMIDT